MDNMKIPRETEITNELYGILRDKIEANWSPTIQEMCRKARAYLKEEYERGRNDGYEAGYVRGQAGTWDDGVKAGMEAAWTAAKKAFSDYSDEACAKAFPKEWNNGGFKAIMKLSPQEAIERIQVYEKTLPDLTTGEIKVGDEVTGSNCKSKNKYVVLRVYENISAETMLTLWDRADGDIDTYHLYLDGQRQFKKTGGSFPQIADYFKLMKANGE